jgi:hypothetical protein
MKVSLAAIALITLAAAPLAAQKPDFSGNWKINTEKSDPMGPPGGMGGQRPPADPNAPRPPGGMGGGMNRMQITEMFITQTDSKFIVEQKMGETSRTSTYALDGSASKNPGMRGNEMVTKSTWVGPAIVTEGENTFTTPNGEMTIKTKETRTLSEDGKTMTVVTIINSPRGEMTRKAVYDKQ